MMSKTVNHKLDIKQIVKEETDFLIGEVEKIENLLKQIVSNSKKEPFGNSQIRNLLAATKNASSVKEVKLYIEYQMSRGNSWDNMWSKHFSGTNLGGEIKRVLDRIDARSKMWELPEGEQKELVLKLMERFFHYWSWKYKYIVATSSKGKGR